MGVKGPKTCEPQAAGSPRLDCELSLPLRGVAAGVLDSDRSQVTYGRMPEHLRTLNPILRSP